MAQPTNRELAQRAHRNRQHPFDQQLPINNTQLAQRARQNREHEPIARQPLPPQLMGTVSFHHRLKSSEIGHVSIYISTTKGTMANRMTALDSARQIGLSTSLEGVLIVVGGSSSLDFKKQRNRGRFRLYIQNQGRHGKTDGSIRFSASNRSIHILGRRTNCSFGAFITGLYKTAKSRPISTISPQPEPLWQTRGQSWIQRIK